MGRIIDRRRVMGVGGNPFIQFADPTMKSLCVGLWGGADGGTAALNTRVDNVKVAGVDGELTYEQAASIKSIATSQFKNNTTITSFDELQYFTGLTTINSNAFLGCSSLTSIAIPSSLTSTGNNVFNNCSSLAAVHISDLEAWCNISYSNMNSNPLFWGYHHLYLNGEEIKDLVIPNTVTTIKTFAFMGGSSFTSVTIPNSVTSIGNSAFYRCSGLTSITLPNNAVTFGSNVFTSCTSLTSVTIPPNVMSIGASMFSGCSLLSTVDIGNITVIPYGAFVSTRIQNVDLSRVTSVEFGAFQNGKLVDVDLSSVVTIGTQGLGNNTLVKSLIIGENCTTINDSALTRLGVDASGGCTMTVKAVTPPTLGTSNLSNAVTIYVPAESVEAYKAASNWSAYADKIQAIPT